MAEVLPFLIGLALAATLIVLFVGIGAFAIGGKFHAKHANTLMRARVVIQGVAVLLFALLAWLGMT
jgi:hypothetical protein